MRMSSISKEKANGINVHITCSIPQWSSALIVFHTDICSTRNQSVDNNCVVDHGSPVQSSQTKLVLLVDTGTSLQKPVNNFIVIATSDDNNQSGVTILYKKAFC
jgi:hypothetical protein